MVGSGVCGCRHTARGRCHERRLVERAGRMRGRVASDSLCCVGLLNRRRVVLLHGDRHGGIVGIAVFARSTRYDFHVAVLTPRSKVALYNLGRVRTRVILELDQNDGGVA